MSNAAPFQFTGPSLTADQVSAMMSDAVKPAMDMARQARQDATSAGAAASSAQYEADQAKAAAAAAQATAAQRVRGFTLGTVKLIETATIALSLGIASKAFDVAGAVQGEPILMTPAVLLPAGWLLGQAVCTANGKVTVTYYRPALALGASVSFDIPLIALRT